MSQRCETEVAKSLSKVQMPQPDIEFRQWFLNPLLGRTFGIVRYRSTWMEQMNNGGWGGEYLCWFLLHQGHLWHPLQNLSRSQTRYMDATASWGKVKTEHTKTKGSKEHRQWVQFMWHQEAPGKEKGNRQLYSGFSSLADVSYRVIKDSLSCDELLQNNRKKDLSWIPRTHIKTKPGVMGHTCNLNTEEGETSMLLGLAGQTT